MSCQSAPIQGHQGGVCDPLDLFFAPDTPMTTLPPLPAQLAQALADKGYDALTPVQAAMLDPALAERDLLVQSPAVMETQ